LALLASFPKKPRPPNAFGNFSLKDEAHIHHGQKIASELATIIRTMNEWEHTP
jgi:hypothetical protein